MHLQIDQFPAIPATPYAQLRDQIQHGDILLCSGTGIFSSMIQQATDSVWSHVGVILRLESLDRIMLLESVEPIGVRTVRLSRYLTGYDEQGRRPYPGGMIIARHAQFAEKVEEQKLRPFAQFAVDQFGYPYDRDEIARIAARIMSAKVPFTPQQRPHIKPDNEYICSEYAARCYDEIGLPIPWNQLGFIAPSDFAADPAFGLVGVMKEMA